MSETEEQTISEITNEITKIEISGKKKDVYKTVCKNCGLMTRSKTNYCTRGDCEGFQKKELYAMRKLDAGKRYEELPGNKCDYIHKDGRGCKKVCDGENTRCSLHINSRVLKPCVTCEKLTYRFNQQCTKCAVSGSYFVYESDAVA